MSINWDNLDVGDPNLNHSEYFFAKNHRHVHEKAPNMWCDKENVGPKPQSTVGKEITRKVTPPGTLCKPTAAVEKSSFAKTSQNGAASRPIALAKKSMLPAVKVQEKADYRVCQYTKIYEIKKQNLIKKLVDEEKQQRKHVFQSKPAPNFKTLHNKIGAAKKPLARVPTIPTTPQCLKKSKETEARRKLKQQQQQDAEAKQKVEPLKQRPPPRVLHIEPFRPKKMEKVAVKTVPFHLASNKRLEARKQFNCENLKRIEERKKLEEEERKLRDNMLAKEFRKKATFKATPNPNK